MLFSSIVIRTKLQVPPRGPHQLERPHLYTHLDEIEKYKLTLVQAPAGYGKSVLLSQWLSARQLESVWYNLDIHDNEAQSFWLYLFTALSAHLPALEQYCQALEKEQPQLRRFISILINQLSTLKHPLYCVLDDYHLIHNQAIQTDFQFFLQYLPPQVHIVLLSREYPDALALDKMRIYGSLLELDLQLLRFSEQDLQSFFTRHEIQLTATEVQEIYQTTEGWALGLKLLQISLKNNRQGPGTLKRLLQKRLQEFLADEIFAPLDSELQNFVLNICVVEQFTSPLCRALVPDAGHRDYLNDLEQAGLFLICLDALEGVYRLHHLFQDWLRQRLKQQEVRYLEQHRRAGEWYAQQEDLSRAIYHLQRAQAWGTLEKLLVRACAEWLKAYRYDSILSACQALPALRLAQDPHLFYPYGKALIETRQVSQFEAFLRLCEAEHSGEGELLLLKAQWAYSLGEWTELLTLLECFEKQAPVEHPLQNQAAIIKGRTYIQRYEFERAIEVHQRALKHVFTHEDLFEAYDLTANIFMPFKVAGRYQEAFDAHAEILQQLEARRLAAPQLQALCYARQAYCAQHLGEVIQVQPLIDVACALLRKETPRLELWILLTRIQLKSWNRKAFQTLWAEVQELYQAHNLDLEHLLTAVMRDLEVEIALYQGEIDACHSWFEQVGLSDLPAHSGFLHLQRLVLYLLYTQAESQALQYLEQEIKRLGEQNMSGFLVPAYALQAFAYQRCDETKQAQQAFAQALQLSEEQGQLGWVYTTPCHFGPLLKQAETQGAGCSPEFLERLRVLAQRYERHTALHLTQVSAQDALLSALSEREREIAGLILEGQSNQEIADNLFISGNTLKTHIRNLYRKLEVSHRHELKALFARET